MGLKDYFFRKEMRRRFRHGRFVSWSSVRSVLILTECATADEAAAVTSIADSVRREGIRVAVGIYTEAKEFSVTPSDELCVITKKDISLFGWPKKGVAASLLGRAFDVAVDLSPRQSWALRYVLVRAQVTMRCGRQGGAYDLYDFMIDDSGASPAELFRQTRLYLEMIRESGAAS